MENGDKLIQITAIDHINFRVEDLGKSIHFYRKVFGFEEKECGMRNGEPWAIIGKSNVAYFCLYQKPNAKRCDQGLRINHFGFCVENFDEIEEKLRSMGVKIFYDGPIECKNSRSLYFEDPSGYEIELSENFGGGLE